MSLPLRHGLENVTSLDRVLEDLLVRFIINCPKEDLSSVERELFHFEEASWFYTDFVKLMNSNLPSLKIKSISQLFIKLCPLIWKWDIKADEALAKFSKYKKTIPVRGAAIFNRGLNKILLVKGMESDSWSFPRGKISKDENDVDCCIREVKEEIGFDLTEYIDEEQFVERTIGGKNYKIYLIKNISEDIQFKPQVRNEIDKIQWFEFKNVTKNIYKGNSSFKYYLINSMIRPLSMWVRNQRQIKNDDQLKQYAEEQLKLLLGITKEEQNDPGRDLLNILQSAVHNNDMNNQYHQPQISTNTPPLSNQSPMNGNNTFYVNNNMNMGPIAAPNQQIGNQVPPPQSTFRSMGFQPFAPFPLQNGSVPLSMPPQFSMNPLQVPPAQQQYPMNLSTDNSMNTNSFITPISNASSTPNIQSLSRPTLANNGTDESNSKELLSLLTKPQKMKSPSSTSVSSMSMEKSKPKLKILQRGEKLNDNDHKPVNNSSTDLLNILKKNNNQNNNQNSITKTEATTQNNLMTQQKTTNSQSLLNMLKNPTNSEKANNIAVELSQPSVNTENNRLPNGEHFRKPSEEKHEDYKIPLTHDNNISENSTRYSDMEPPEEYYSTFEDTTDSESDDLLKSESRRIEDDTQSENEREELEALNDDASLDLSTIPREILNENHSYDGVPHRDVNTESAISVNSEQNARSTIANASSTTLSKPKFKILKRGEKLNDVLAKETSETQAESILKNYSTPNNSTDDFAIESAVDSTNNELMDMLAKNKNKNPRENMQNISITNQNANSELLNLLKTKNQGNEDHRYDSSLKSTSQKSADTNNELLNMLKKNSEVKPTESYTNTTNSNPTEMLSVLRGDNEQTNTLRQNNINYAQNPGFMPTSNESSFQTSASMTSPNNMLLNMLKGNSNNSNMPASPPQNSGSSPFDSRFGSVSPQSQGFSNLADVSNNLTSINSNQSNAAGSNELLNILHRK